jgi:hypothetical protein
MLTSLQVNSSIATPSIAERVYSIPSTIKLIDSSSGVVAVMVAISIPFACI